MDVNYFTILYWFICSHVKVKEWLELLTKEAGIYKGLKTISLTSGAGKTGQPIVKEWN